jgi:hypothetical protein
MGVRMSGAFATTALAALLAIGCSSEELPPSANNASSGSSNGSGSSPPAGTAGASGAGGIRPTGDGGVGGAASGNASMCGGPYLLFPQKDSSLPDVCPFQLTVAPPDQYSLRVFEDEALTKPIPMSSSDGWSWAEASDTRILLTGSFCTDPAGPLPPPLWALYACPLPPIP